MQTILGCERMRSGSWGGVVGYFLALVGISSIADVELKQDSREVTRLQGA